MVFKIFTSWGDERLLDKYPALSKYGYCNEHKTSSGTAGFIDINSLEDLMILQKDVYHPIIIDMEGKLVPKIEIYDALRE